MNNYQNIENISALQNFNATGNMGNAPQIEDGNIMTGGYVNGYTILRDGIEVEVKKNSEEDGYDNEEGDSKDDDDGKKFIFYK